MAPMAVEQLSDIRSENDRVYNEVANKDASTKTRHDSFGAKSRNVSVQLNYLADLALYKEVKPLQIVPGFLDKEGRSNVKLSTGPEEVIQDIRGANRLFNLDRNGFKYVLHETDFKDWDKQDAIGKVYVQQIEELIKREVPGADEVYIADVRLRFNADVGTKSRDGLYRNPYARQVHVDDTESSLLPKFHGILDMKADWYDRIRVINVWRPINQPVHDCALAVCDVSSLNAGDVIECDRVRRDTMAYHDTMGVVKHRPGYSWWYMSEQTPDEVVMFTQYDSDVTKKRKPEPGCCLHTAFDMPGPMPEGAKPRESVEVRAFVFTYPRSPTRVQIRPLSLQKELSSLNLGNVTPGNLIGPEELSWNPSFDEQPSPKPAEPDMDAEFKDARPEAKQFRQSMLQEENKQLRKQFGDLQRTNEELVRLLRTSMLEGRNQGNPNTGSNTTESQDDDLTHITSRDQERSWDHVKKWQNMYLELAVRTGWEPYQTQQQEDSYVGLGPYYYLGEK